MGYCVGSFVVGCFVGENVGKEVGMRMGSLSASTHVKGEKRRTTNNMIILLNVVILGFD